jgi:hypothetical protein
MNMIEEYKKDMEHSIQMFVFKTISKNIADLNAASRTTYKFGLYEESDKLSELSAKLRQVNLTIDKIQWAE